MNLKFSKKNIVLLLAILVTTANCTLATPFWKHSKKVADPNASRTDEYGQKVISDTESANLKKQKDKAQLINQKQRELKDALTKEEKEKIQEDLNNINSYTDTFFTSVEKQKVQKRIKAESAMSQMPTPDENFNSSKGTTPPIKRLRLKLKQMKNQKGKNAVATPVATTTEEPKNQAILDCDLMNYFADKEELQADGNASLYFPTNGSTLKADHITYNQASNIIKAKGNVVIIKDGKEIFGDFMNIDMNEENAFVDNPKAEMFQMVSHAKKGYMYGDKMIQENGQLICKQHTNLHFVTDFFGPDLTQMLVKEQDKSNMSKDTEAFRIDTKDLIIKSTAEHETVSLKHATIYFHEKKLGTIPGITLHTNKAHDYVEANYPEFGTTMNLGSFIGPGFVFDTPHGSTLKIVPMFNYHHHNESSDSSDKDYGFGGIVKFKSATNMTQAAFGTSDHIFVMRGKQRLDDHLYLQYGTNSFLDDWFLGFRMPKLSTELIYNDEYPIKNTLGKDRDFTYRERLSAGYMQDFMGNPKSLWADGAGIGTTRFKYMGEATQNLYNYTNPDKLLKFQFNLIGQGSAGFYGTGQSQVIARIGPNAHTQYKYWMQDVGYFLSGYSDDSPFVYDKYVYGRSNAYVRESLRVSKYLTLSWFGSFNLSDDSWNGDLMQEDSFFVSIGPDDVKLNLGYDTVRKQTYFTVAFNLDAKNSQINYKKFTVINPDTLGKNKDKNPSETSGSETNGFFTPDEQPAEERAEVIDINPYAKEEM